MALYDKFLWYNKYVHSPQVHFQNNTAYIYNYIADIQWWKVNLLPPEYKPSLGIIICVIPQKVLLLTLKVLNYIHSFYLIENRDISSVSEKSIYSTAYKVLLN